MDKKQLALFALAGAIGALLIGLALGGRGEQVEAADTGGIESITTERICEFIKLEGQTYFRCTDGFAGKVRPFASEQGDD